MVLPEELRPVPDLPNRIILKGSASDEAKHRHFTVSCASTSHRSKVKPVAMQHFCDQEMNSVNHMFVSPKITDLVKSLKCTVIMNQKYKN